MHLITSTSWVFVYNLYFQTLVCIGAMFILKYGKTLNTPRSFLIRWKFFEELFKCGLCLGFWIGIIYGIYLNSSVLQWGLYSSAICWLADNIISTFQKHLYPK